MIVRNSWRSGPSAIPTWWTNWKTADGCAGRKRPAETLHDLRYGLEDKDQFGWLRRYHEAELMRIGLRDILGLADFEQNLRELSALAAACLQYALEVVCRQRRLAAAPFCIIGLGKLGGAEVGYGSDLDVLFVAPSGTKNLPACQTLAAAVMDLLSRPDGAWDCFSH